jgi:hypothetical protein
MEMLGEVGVDSTRLCSQGKQLFVTAQLGKQIGTRHESAGVEWTTPASTIFVGTSLKGSVTQKQGSVELKPKQLRES